MKVILNNGMELEPIIVTGEKRHVQNARRDCLGFVFAETGLDEIDAVFNAENCEKIVIIGDDGSEAIYKGYTIRVELAKNLVEVSQATAEAEATYENRVHVTMAERTFAENKLLAMEAQNMDTMMAVAELGVLLAGGME